MVQLTKEDRTRMQGLVEQAREALVSAELAALAYEATTAIPVFGWVVAKLETAEADLVHNTRQARPNFDDWSTTRVKWVERGTGSEGYPYTLKMWLDHGKALVSQLGDADLGALFDASAFSTLAYGTAATVADVGELAVDAAEVVADVAKGAADIVTKPWALPTKVALWAVGGTVLLAAAGYGLRPFLSGLLAVRSTNNNSMSRR
jgi:hypothetical protein